MLRNLDIWCMILKCWDKWIEGCNHANQLQFTRFYPQGLDFDTWSELKDTLLLEQSKGYK